MQKCNDEISFVKGLWYLNLLDLWGFLNFDRTMIAITKHYE